MQPGFGNEPPAGAPPTAVIVEAGFIAVMVDAPAGAPPTAVIVDGPGAAPPTAVIVEPKQ